MSTISSPRDKAKEKAAVEAVRNVKNNWSIGLGSGSTIVYVASELTRRISEEKLNVFAVPSSYQSYLIAVANKIPVTSLDEHPVLNLGLDGADEVDLNLNAIKGGGAALMREKIVAFASQKYFIVVDETKLVNKLGTTRAVPIEVLPFAAGVVLKNLKRFWSAVKIREGKGKVGPIVTDNGNFIIDINCGEIENPKEMDVKLRSIPGVLETGLFIGMADRVYVGNAAGKVRYITRKPYLR